MSLSQNNDMDIASLLISKPNESAVDYVINSIKELLLTNKLMPGEKLPSEMELAKLLSVSRGSVREAMKILSSFGIIEIRRGDGTYVSSGGNKVSFDPLLFSLILSQPGFEELRELRLLIEKDVVRLVISHASDEELKLLRKCHEALDVLKYNKENNYEILLNYDLEFHHILGQLTKNMLIGKIYSFIMEYFKPYIAKSIRKHSYFSLESNQTHGKILEAVEKRDVASAEKAVEDSVNVWLDLINK